MIVCDCICVRVYAKRTCWLSEKSSGVCTAVWGGMVQKSVSSTSELIVPNVVCVIPPTLAVIRQSAHAAPEHTDGSDGVCAAFKPMETIVPVHPTRPTHRISPGLRATKVGSSMTPCIQAKVRPEDIFERRCSQSACACGSWDVRGNGHAPPLAGPDVGEIAVDP